MSVIDPDRKSTQTSIFYHQPCRLPCHPATAAQHDSKAHCPDQLPMDHQKHFQQLADRYGLLIQEEDHKK